MNEFTKGEWDSNGNEAYINDDSFGFPSTKISATVDPGRLYEDAISFKEIDATASMFAAAGTAATALAEAGYDAVEVFRALPELIASFGFANTDDLLRRIKGE